MVIKAPRLDGDSMPNMATTKHKSELDKKTAGLLGSYAKHRASASRSSSKLQLNKISFHMLIRIQDNYALD